MSAVFYRGEHVDPVALRAELVERLRGAPPDEDTNDQIRKLAAVMEIDSGAPVDEDELADDLIEEALDFVCPGERICRTCPEHQYTEPQDQQ